MHAYCLLYLVGWRGLQVVKITKNNPDRLFAGVIKPFGKGHPKKQGLFVSKDYRVPRIIVLWEDMVRGHVLLYIDVVRGPRVMLVGHNAG